MASIKYNYDKKTGKLISIRYRVVKFVDANNKPVLCSMTDNDIPEKYRNLKQGDPIPKRFEKEINDRAESFQARVQENYSKGRIDNYERMKFQAFVEEVWRPSLIASKRKQTTINFYDNQLKTILVSPHFHNRKIGSINAIDIDRYLNDLRNVEKNGEKRYSDATIKHHRDVLRAIFNYAEKKRVFSSDDNPIKAANEVAVEEKEVVALSTDEVKLFKAALAELPEEEERWRCMMTLFLQMGLRRGEAVGLTWGNVDFENKRMNICQSATMGKGGEPVITAPKSKNSNRVLPINDEVIAALKAWKKRAEEEEYKVRFSDSSFVFPSRFDATIAMYPTSPTKWLNEFLTDYNKSHKIQLPLVSPHDLRHTFGSMLVAADVPIAKVSRYMGHSSITVTEKFYVKMVADDLISVAEAAQKVTNSAHVEEQKNAVATA